MLLYQLSNTVVSSMYHEWVFNAFIRYPLLFFQFFFFMRTVINIYYLHALVNTGCTPSPSYNDPFKADSLTNFWGKRWNLPIRDLLGDLFFFPLKRVGYPMVGRGCTFFASAGMLRVLFISCKLTIRLLCILLIPSKLAMHVYVIHTF